MQVEFRRCRAHTGELICPEDDSCSLGIVLKRAQEAEEKGKADLRLCLYDLAHETMGTNVWITSGGLQATCSNIFGGATTGGILTLVI